GRLVVWLGSLPAGSAIILSALAVAVFVVGSVLEPRLTLETDPVNWVDQGSEGIKDIRTREREIGGASDLGVLIEAEGEGSTVFTDEIVDYVNALTIRTVEDFPDDLIVDSSIIGTVRKLTDVPGVPSIAPTAESVRAAWDAAPVGV